VLPTPSQRKGLSLNQALSATMPDIANEMAPAVQGTLNRVGMQNVELPLLVMNEKGITMMVPGKIDLYVDLSDPTSKGIHMSRLYQSAMNLFESETLNFEMMNRVLDQFLLSHSDISTEAAISASFEWMTKRSSLVSGIEGWRSYPIKLHASKKHNKVVFAAEVEIMYSSTCPCSASLARQLIQNRFIECFQDTPFIERDALVEWLGLEDSICATPHSQRSIAHVKVKLNKQAFNPIDLVNQVEHALGTSVQAMVKREDEQEFAKLNGKNLMFCEDAARKIKAKLENSAYEDYRCEVQHYESLHPHDAVAIVVKGIHGGFVA